MRDLQCRPMSVHGATRTRSFALRISAYWGDADEICSPRDFLHGPEPTLGAQQELSLAVRETPFGRLPAGFQQLMAKFLLVFCSSVCLLKQGVRVSLATIERWRVLSEPSIGLICYWAS